MSRSKLLLLLLFKMPLLLMVLASCLTTLDAQDNGKDEDDRIGKMSLAQFVFDMTDQYGVEEGVATWNEYNESKKFYIEPRDFLNSAFVLHQSGKTIAAVAILENCRRASSDAKKSLAWEYSLQFFSNGKQAATKWMDENRASNDFAFNETELNLAARLLFSLGNTDQARALAEIFLQRHPKSADAHERLAEVLLAEGKREQALEKYRQRLALDKNQTSFFHLAAQPPTIYSPTKLPDDINKLFRAEGNVDSETVFVFVQGGPCPYFGVYNPPPLSLLPEQDGILRVAVTESQILNPGMLAADPPLTEQQSLFEHQQSAEILHRVVKHFKGKGKNVFVIGHSYGCHIGLEYLLSKPNLANRIILMGSDLDEDLRNYPQELVGTGRIVRWTNGVEPYERDFFGNFGVKPLLNENLNRIFQNTGGLVSYHGKRRFTELLKDKDLSNVVFVHAKFDESNGRTKPYELEFWRSRGAKTLESYGDHHSMLSPARMANYYEHLLNAAQLKQSVASFISDKTAELESAAKAIELYQSNQEADKFHAVVESEINVLGYQLIAQSKLAEAIAVFQFNASLFPSSWNAHDSLGESLLSDGKLMQATSSYSKSLELNPGNTLAIAALRRIMAMQEEKEVEKANASDHVYAKGVNEVVQQCMQEQHLPGFAVVLVHEGKTIFKRGYGVANVETEEAVDPDQTLFRIGSISKALTLLTLTRLVDDGRIGLDDDVSKYFDGIRNRGEYGKPVTIRHLLTHTSGFDQIGGRDRQIYRFNSSLKERKKRRPDLIEYLQADKLRRVSSAGQYFRYDTYGSCLAGAVIEKVTVQPYSEAMKQEMFTALGMNSSFVEVPEDRYSELAVGYGFRNGKYIAQPYEVFATTPASSIDATPVDMGRLLEALTSDGSNAHGRLFSDQQTQKVLSPQFRSHPEFVGITHGLFESFTSRRDGFQKHVRTVAHGGSMRGYFASMTLVPDAKLGIFVVTNRAPEAGGGPVRLGPIVERVIENLSSIPNRVAHPVPKRNRKLGLAEYEGEFYYGVFCHSADENDIANGAWPRPAATVVTENNGAITIRDETYLPRGEDVFVREDGGRLVYFGRDDEGAVSFFLYSTSPDTFERMDR